MTIEKRINIIIGQLEAIKKLADDEGIDCDQLLTQLKASKSALNSVYRLIVKREMDRCLPKVSEQKQKKITKLLAELNNL